MERSPHRRSNRARLVSAVLLDVSRVVIAWALVTSVLSAQSTFSTAGGRAQSASYSSVDSLGEAFEGGTVTTPQIFVRQGFVGQLAEPRSLTVSSQPNFVNEGETTQLSAVATLDDDSLVRLTPTEPQWSVREGPLTGVSPSGVVSAGPVFINTPATVRALWQGISGDLTLTVRDTSVIPPGPNEPPPGFTAQDFTADSAGLYQGILRDSSGHVLGAILNLALKSTGSFTAKVVLNGVTHSLTGSLQANGSFSGMIPRAGNVALMVSLQIGRTTAGGLTLSSSVTADGTTGTGFIAQAPYSLAQPAPVALVKSYTFLIPRVITGDPARPEGDGYGSAKVSASGIITAAGKTGDGVAFTTSGLLSADQQWHMFQTLYQNQGQIAGVLTFRDVAGVSDLDGPLRWIKNPRPTNASYPLGFALAPNLIGSVYTPPVARQRALSSLMDQFYNARFVLAGLGIPNGGFSKTVHWLNTNQITYSGPETLTATATSSSGILTGTYRDAQTRLTVGFAGAVFQKQQLVGGNYLLANMAGLIAFEPGINFGYPGSELAGVLPRIATPDTSARTPLTASVLFSDLAAGTYGGLLKRGTEITGGLESMVVTKTGALSGTVIVLGRRHAFRGTMGSNGQATLLIARAGLPSIVSTLQLVRVEGTLDGWQLTGSFIADGLTHTLEAALYPNFSIVSPAPQAGRYTLALRAPDDVDTSLQPGGDGYASLTVAVTGNCTGTWVLADGTLVTLGGRVSRASEWFVHRSLYGSNGGYLAGKMTFRDVVGKSDLDGSLRWVKPAAVPRTTTYPAGFDTTRTGLGCRYLAPLSGQRAFGSLTPSLYNAWLRFAGPDMSTLPSLELTSLDRVVTWSAANQILYYGPDKITLYFTPSTGLLTGTCTDVSKGVSFSLGGALLQKQGLLTGRYVANGKSGLLTLHPR